MTRLHIAWANLRDRLHLLADHIYDRTHEPDHLGDWADVLHRMNRDESWEGLRHRAGRLVDERGRFAKPGAVA